MATAFYADSSPWFAELVILSAEILILQVSACMGICVLSIHETE